jgi:phosphoribosylformylglycinamidine synthase
MIAVSEAARNIVCAGGNPSAITNCLNFGNPYNPESYWQFVGAIKGMSTACLKFATPVTGGNVSFYNQSVIGGVEVPVFPTPTIGMIGVLADKSKLMTLDFKQKGDLIFILGDTVEDIASSEYLASYHKIQASPAPHFDLEEEFTLQQLVASLIKERLIESAHDISEGGLIITLLESAFFNHKGFEVSSNATSLRKDAYWMGEAQSRVVVSCSDAQLAKVEAAAKKLGVECTLIGKVNEGNIQVDGESWGTIANWKNSYDTAIENKLA